MKGKLLAAAAAALMLAGTANAAGFPDYYPENGFQKIGRVDAVYSSENRVVINDRSYELDESVIVYSRSSANDSLARIRPGAVVGFRVNNNRITKFWLLPRNYKRPKRR